MKKKTTFLKLFTLLVLSCLSISYAWADSHTIKFDRDQTSTDLKFNCTSCPVPSDASWKLTGSNFSKPTWTWITSDYRYHYIGYSADTEEFTITFENFKYQVTGLLFSADAGDEVNATGYLNVTSYDKTLYPKSVSIPDNLDKGLFDLGNDKDITYTQLTWPTISGEDDLKNNWTNYITQDNQLDIKGISTLQYKHGCNTHIFFDWSNFLQIRYEDPKISIDTKSLDLDTKYTLSSDDVTWTYQGAFTADDITYSSSNTSVVSVNEQTLTGIGFGSATITANLVNNGTTVASCEFTVNVPSPKISISDQYLGVNNTYALNSGDVTWTHKGSLATDNIKFTSSSDASIVSVSEDGKTLTGTGVGSATITAQVVNNEGTSIDGASCTFTVKTNNITTTNNNPTISGTWADATTLANAIAEKIDASTTVVDLTNATVSDGNGTKVTVPTNGTNILIKAKSFDQVSNTSNVIVDGICNKLALADGTRFSTAEPFTANATEYSRSTAATWGTICLPYAPPTENADYYELTSATESSLTFTKVEKPQANTPYLYKNKIENSYYNASYTTDVAVVATPSSFTSSTQGIYTMHGVFNPLSIIDGVSTKYKTAKNENYDLMTNANAYYYGTNQFMKINGRLNLAGFRAYLTSEATTGTGSGKSAIGINFDDDDISTAVQFIENEENDTVKVIFDTNGRKLNAPHKGINIINGKKVLVK